MPTSLLKLIEDEFFVGPSRIANLRVTRHTGGAWTYETVDIEFRELRIRVQLEGGPLDVQFGSTADPLSWFNFRELRGFLRDEAASCDPLDTSEVLTALRRFVDQHLSAIAELFSNANYPEAKRALLLFRREANIELLGGRKRLPTD